MNKHQVNNVQKRENSEIRTLNLLLKPIPLYLFLLFSLLLYLVLCFINRPEIKKSNYSAVINQTIQSEPCARIIRQSDLNFIRPLLFVETSDEGGSLIPLKMKINDYINQKINDKTITSASIYFSNYKTSNHFEINPEVLYDPASIMKVPLLLIFLQHAEDDPGLLQKRIFYKEPYKRLTSATITDKTIAVGKSYSIEELLYSMIVYSDNEAFWLLQEEVHNDEYEKLCKDFNVPVYTDNIRRSNNKQNFIANANSISRFFRVLFNASFLSRKMSSYALKLMTESKYHDGIMNGIDPNVTVAHKFGEREELGECQLHEFGIVYLPNRPYMIGVMTKGPDKNKLPKVLSDISKIAFDELKNK